MLRYSKRLQLLLVTFLLAPLAASTGFSGTGPVEAASVPTTVKLIPVVSGLTTPVFITNAGDGSNRLFIVQQTGQIRIFKNGSLLSTPFLNISGLVSNFTGLNSEQGLLGLAFDPSYSSNGKFYITYTTNTSDLTFSYTTTLARYQVSSGNPDLADKFSGKVLLSIPKKWTNHNGGMIAFGPDGYLYMSMGDGGSGGDPDGNAQNLHSMLGKLLRLDVHTAPPAGKTYVIPSTNPFYTSSDPKVKKEIWAYGLRNPWRFSFNRLTGDLFIGDVGQDTEEEVDFQTHNITGGQNYGWHIREGNLCYNPSTGCVSPPHYVSPVATYDHGVSDSYGCALTGGYVYEGSQFPPLQGVYFYGDYCSGKLLGLVKNPNNTWSHRLIASTPYTISTFGQDEHGELYLADYGGGTIYRIAGEVIISGNAGDTGVTLHYNDGGAKTGTSGSNGRYSFTVPYHWSGTVTPTKAGVTFLPASRTYNSITASQTNQNYIDRVSFKSDTTFDGNVLETSENSNVGGTTNSAAGTFKVGDDVLNRQYRSILSFNTGSLPDTAVITLARLKINKQGLMGSNPFATLGNILVDIRNGDFSGNPALESSDFQALANMNQGGIIMNAPLAGGWYQTNLFNTAFPFINKTGDTQLRLRFSVDDNNNLTPDYLNFYSGDYSTVSLRPMLVIEYHLP